MDIRTLMAAGAACGGAIGLRFFGELPYDASLGKVALTKVAVAEVGATVGAVVGGIAGLVRKARPVALGAILGGTAGLTVGIPVCLFLTAFATESSRLTDTQALCFFSVCSCIPATVGSIVGATLVKINSLAAQAFEKNIIQPAVQRALQDARVTQQSVS